MDTIKYVLAAAQEISKIIPGLEVIGEDYKHLQITDSRLAMFLEPLNTLGNRPNPPKIFHTQVESVNDDQWRPIPWIAPHRKFFNQHYATLEGPVVVSFVNYSSNASDIDDQRRQNMKYAKRRQDQLVEAGISAENQIVHIMGDRVAEPVVQKLAVLWLRSQGWLVSEETQYSPHRYLVGAPDVVAWRSPLLASLQEAGLVQSGATIDELAYLTKKYSSIQTHSQTSTRSSDKQGESLVAEVKGSNKSPGAYRDQLRKYLSSGFFDYGYGIIPGYRDWTPNRGLITFDDSGIKATPRLNELTEENQTGWVRKDTRDWFIRHMDKVACQALLCNLDYKQIQDLATDADSEPIEHPYDLVEVLWKHSPEPIITEIAECLD